jgi:hypothetical protein
VAPIVAPVELKTPTSEQQKTLSSPLNESLQKEEMEFVAAGDDAPLLTFISKLEDLMKPEFLWNNENLSLVVTPNYCLNILTAELDLK